MSDDQRVVDSRRGNAPVPVLRTRPATMLTAIGLCLFIMIMQLLPEFRDGGLPRFGPGQSTRIVTR